ncbi:MAG: hypothetical protein JWO30_3431 [Fibrobacteres bacterium]|nr:hypothetical protein [Fibrobacterota bacterium]
MSEADMVQAGNYSHLIQAELAKSILTGLGIDSELFNGKIDGYYNNAVGGIRLMVKREDLETAKEALSADMSVDEEIVTLGEEIGDGKIYCSACHSKKIEEKSITRAEGGNTIIGKVKSMFAGTIEYRCLDCGNTWKN